MVKERDKTKKQPIKELAQLRRRIAELEQSEIEHKRNKQALQTTNERLQYLLTSTSVAIYTSKTSENYGATAITENVKQMTGYEPREFIENSSFWLDHIHPEDQVIISEQVPKIFEKEFHAYEYRFRCKDNRYIWIRDEMKLVRDNAGTPLEIVGFWVDITARKEAEQALQESEGTFRALAENANDGILVAIGEGLQAYANKRASEITGYSVAELLKSTIKDLVHPDELEKIMERYRKRLAGETISSQYETIILRKGGKSLPIELTAAKTVWQGQPADLVIIRDITERKRAEEILRAERDKAKQYLNVAEVVLVALNKKGEITLINRRGNQILGYKEGELLGKNWFTTCLPSPFRKNVKAVFLRLMAGEGKITEFYENPVLTKSGTTRMITWHNTLLKDVQGKNIGTLSSGEDITERKKVEEALKGSEQKFRTIFEGAIDGILLADIETKKFHTGNTTICTMLGYSLEEIKKLGVKDIHPKEALPFVMEQFGKLTRGEITKTNELPVQRMDGSVFYAEISSALLKLDAKTYLMGTFRNITDRKQAEAALRESEEKYRNLVERANDGIGIAQNAILHYVNPRLAQITGYSIEELIGLPFSDFFIPEEVPKVVDNYRRRMAGKKIIPIYESALRHKNGSRIEVELNAGIISYKEKPADMVMVRDITERKKTEEALRKSEDKYRTILENIEEGYYEVDLAGNFTFFNDAMCRIWGYPKEELMGMNNRRYTDKENTKRLFQAFNEVYRTGEIGKGYAYEIIKKDGTRSYVEASISSRKDSSGKAIGFRGIIRDITERKQAEKKLRESEEKFRFAFENANTGVCLVDLDGNLTRVNSKMCEIFGYTKEDLERMTVNDIAHPEDVDLSPQFIQKTLRGELDRATFGKRYFHKKGHVVICEVSSSLVRNTEGTPLYFISHLNDITDRKQAEEEVKRSYEQLQETLHATVSALASTVEMKDQYTAGHQPRVTQLACAIAEEMGLPPEQIEGIRMAASIHDIGKIMVPAEILNKPGPLTEIQYEMIKMHPRAGYDILKGLKLPWPVAQIILQHHELMNGSGYPQKLSGDKIMTEAKILTVANVVEAMNAHRPYRPAFDIKEALAEISKNRGILYDSTAVDACLRLFAEKRFAFG